MAVLISLLLFIPVALYTVVSATPLVHRSLFGVSLAELIAGRAIAAHSIVLGLALLTFAAASASLFMVRNNMLMIGSKKTLLVFGTLALLCSIVLGMQLFKAAKPILLDFEKPTALIQQFF